MISWEVRNSWNSTNRGMGGTGSTSGGSFAIHTLRGHDRLWPVRFWPSCVVCVVCCVLCVWCVVCGVWCVWCGVVWCGVVWCGVVWCGVVWCGVVWCGVVWCGVVWCALLCSAVQCCAVLCCAVVWCGVVWCGVVWCGVVWCGVVWCGVCVVPTFRGPPSAGPPSSGPPSAGPPKISLFFRIFVIFCLSQGVFLVIRPNPILHFAPFLSTHFFPCLNPILKNGSFLSVVALVSVTLLDSNPRLSAEKISNLAPTPSSSLARTRTIELPECQERRGAKTKESVFL